MGKFRVEITGLNLDRFINALYEKGIYLENVSRVEYDKLILECKTKDFKRVEEVLNLYKLQFAVVGGSGIGYLLKSCWYRFGLLLGVVFTIFVCFFTTQVYWRVEVEVEGGNVEIQHLVEEFLVEENLKIGAKRQNISTRDMERLILKNVKGCSMVVVETEGVNLKVFVKPAVEEGVEKQKDIVAGFSGVIERIDFISGNLLVNVGEAVVSGQPLITSSDIGDVFMEAKGDIFARCWIDGTQVGSNEIKNVKRTGRVVEINFLECFGQRFYSGELTEEDAKNMFSKYETEIKEVKLSQNNLLPIKKFSIYYYEIEESCDIIPDEQLIEGLKAEALKNARAKLPEKAEEIDVTYKVIKMGEMTKVVCNIETVLNITTRRE